MILLPCDTLSRPFLQRGDNTIAEDDREAGYAAGEPTEPCHRGNRHQHVGDLVLRRVGRHRAGSAPLQADGRQPDGRRRSYLERRRSLGIQGGCPSRTEREPGLVFGEALVDHRHPAQGLPETCCLHTIFDAIWAFRHHCVLPENLGARFFGHSLAAHGWIYLIVAAALIVCAFLVLNRSRVVARWIEIAARAIRCISAIWRMPFYSIWSLTYVAISVLVIFAFVAYGSKAEIA